MPTPHPQRPLVSSPRYWPHIPPLRPQQSFPHHPSTTDPHQRTTTPAQNPHLGGVHGQQHMKSTPFARPRYRLHTRLLVIQRALPKAHSPHPLADGLNLSRQHTAFHTGHKDPILDFTSFKPSRH